MSTNCYLTLRLTLRLDIDPAVRERLEQFIRHAPARDDAPSGPPLSHFPLWEGLRVGERPPYNVPVGWLASDIIIHEGVDLGDGSSGLHGPELTLIVGAQNLERTVDETDVEPEGQAAPDESRISAILRLFSSLAPPVPGSFAGTWRTEHDDWYDVVVWGPTGLQVLGTISPDNYWDHGGIWTPDLAEDLATGKILSCRSIPPECFINRPGNWAKLDVERLRASLRAPAPSAESR